MRVVPEIDVPGHINAATHVYGDLMPDGVPTDAYSGIEVGFSRLTFDLPATEPFLRDVFTDLAHATDGEHVHLGGDEVLKMEPAEYARFVELCERLILEAGKKPVAWQEAAKAPLRPGTLVQYWDTHPMDLTYLVDAATAGARHHVAREPRLPGHEVHGRLPARPGLGGARRGARRVRLGARAGGPGDAGRRDRGRGGRGLDGAHPHARRAVHDAPAAPDRRRGGRVDGPDRKDWDDYRRRVAREAHAWRRTGTAFHPSEQVDW